MSDHTIMIIWVMRNFFVQFFVYFCHLFLISSASVRPIPFLSFIEPIFAWNIPLVSLRRKFGHRGSMSISLVFCTISLAVGWYCNLNSHPSGQCSLSPRGYHGHAVAQNKFKWLLLRVRGSNCFQLSRTYILASHGHLLGSGLVISHLKNSNVSKENKKEKN